MISLINHDSSEGEQCGRYNLPRFMETPIWNVDITLQMVFQTDVKNPPFDRCDVCRRLSLGTRMDRLFRGVFASVMWWTMVCSWCVVIVQKEYFIFHSKLTAAGVSKGSSSNMVVLVSPFFPCILMSLVYLRSKKTWTYKNNPCFEYMFHTALILHVDLHSSIPIV